MSAIYWTDERIATAMQTWTEAHHGVPPSCITWRRAGPHHPSFVTVIERCGSFTDALAMAGYGPNSLRRTIWTRERIIAAIQGFHREHGRAPTFAEWRAATPETPAGSSVQRLFGTWNKALVEALSERRGKRQWWTRERVINCLLDHLMREGRWPVAGDWKSGAGPKTHPNASTVARLFGSWTAGINAARGTERGARRYLDAEPFGSAVRGYIGQSGSLRLVSELSGVEESIVQKLARGGKKFVREDTAEALATALSRPDLMVAA